MSKIIFIILIALISACSTHIHLVTEGYSQQKVTHLRQSLVESGYQVTAQNIVIPEEFPNSVIAVNPSYRSFKTIEDLRLLLGQLGFSPAVERRFGQGHHFYTKDNIGLYLRNPDVVTEGKMPPYLRTQYCNKGDANLEFKSSGEFILETERYDNDDYLLEYSKGKWQLVNRILTLQLDNGKVAIFTKDQQQVETHQGLKPADVFIPKRENAAMKQLSCKFLIIYMD